MALRVTLEGGCACGQLMICEPIPVNPYFGARDLEPACTALIAQGARQVLHRDRAYCGRICMACPACGEEIELPRKIEGEWTSIPVRPEWRG